MNTVSLWVASSSKCRLPSACFAVLAAVATVLTPWAALDAAESHGGIEWLDVEAGLALAAKERRAICLVIPGPEPESHWASLEESLFKSTKVTKRIQAFVPIALSGEVPGVLRGILGDVGREPMIVLLDFRNKILQRWVNEIPSRDRFSTLAKVALLENEQLATKFKSAAAAVRKIRYAVELRNYRDSVLLLLEAEGLQLPAEDPTALDLKAVRTVIEDEYRSRFDQAREFEQKREYVRAIEHLEALLRDFPFPDREKATRQEIRRLWSLIRV